MRTVTGMLLVCLLLVVPGWSNAREASKPNVILIMADDLGWETIGCYGGQDYKTPELDRLAANGIRFEHCYSTPICTTSRVKIMTGKYNFRNYTYFGYLNPKEKTFGNLMKQAGYKTAIAGKWQLNGLYNPNDLPGGDDPNRPVQAGFDEYCLWQLTKDKKQGGERYWSPMLEQNGKVLSKEDNDGKFGPDIMSNFLMGFMEKYKGEPFFLYYPMVLPHSPFIPTPDTIDASGKKGSAKVSKKDHFVAMVQYVDTIVGRIVKKTEELGIAENTVIMFTSDNGTHRSMVSAWQDQKIQGGKGMTTDMGTHVPLITYWKGQTPEGQVLNDLIDFTDFYPTLAGLAGIKMGKEDPIDGVSFLPQLRGEKGTPRAWVFNHYQPYWQLNSALQGAQFARTANHKLYRDGRFVAPPVDLKEENDLAAKIPEPASEDFKILKALLDKSPPVHSKGGRNAKERPVHPDWESLLGD